MSGSDRGSRTSHLAIWATTGWLTLCLIIGAIFYSEGAKIERYRNQPYEYAQSAEQQAYIVCADVDRAAIFKCIFDHVERVREEARAEQDVDAQQDMAMWAMLMFFATVATVGITGIGVWFVWKTLDATLVAVGSTVKATDAIIRQNNLAEQAQRPWITIQPKTWGPFVVESERLTGTVHFEIKNVGTSPASFVQVLDTVFPKIPETSEAKKFYAEKCVEAENKIWGEIIPPNGTTYTKVSVDVAWHETNKVIIGDGQKVIAPAICVVSSYFAVGGQACLQTGMCFIIGRVEDGSFRVIFHEPQTYGFKNIDIVAHPGACIIT